MSAGFSRFPCTSCGKQYRWKTELAGKRVKCSCGQAISVPAAVETPPEDDLFQLREEPVVPRRVVRPPVIPAADAAPLALSYAAPTAVAGASINPQRDLILPGAFLIGAIFLLCFTATIQQGSVAVLIVEWFLIALAIVPVIGAFIGYGLLNSKRLEITNRSFLIASFKFMVIIFVADVVNGCVYDYLRWTGAIAGLRVYVIILVPFIFSILLITKAVSYFFFNSQDDDFVATGFPLAVAMWVSHFVILVLIYAILWGVLQVLKAPPPSAPVIAAAPASPVITGAAPPVAVTPTAADRAIMQAAYQGITVRDAHDGFYTGHNGSATHNLLEGLYGSGANKIYFDMRTVGTGSAPLIYVELPLDPGQASSLFGQVSSICDGNPHAAAGRCRADE